MKLSTEAYKGVRDFYPEDMAIQNQIFGIWSSIAEKYGYQEYGASILEPAELYRAKSGEEIVNEQTYTFTDRGDREVTLRPEMTPTVARMVAGRRRELAFPLRWYSTPNLFRYEQPQRGRLREHFQLNVDIFGVTSIQAEIEVIQMAYDITRGYGLKDTDFEIRLNNRKVMNCITHDVFGLDDETARKVSKLIDKKDKLAVEIFKNAAKEILNEKSDKFLTLINSKNFEEFTANLPQTKEEHEGLREIREVIDGLEKLGITNVRFDQTVMRGFDYYTGIVFEVFDNNPKNRRSVFGGGRYDDLLSLFGSDKSSEKVCAVGFGAGDVIARDLIESYSQSESTPVKTVSPADLGICIVDIAQTGYANDLAQSLRNQGVRVSVDYSSRKVSDQIKNADKKRIPYITCIGQNEIDSGELTLKNLSTGEEQILTQDKLADSVLHA